MMITKARLIPAAVVMAGVATVLAPGSPAMAFISPPLVLLAQPQSPAHLVAKGAALDVTVQYTCTADRMGINLQLTEVIGKKIASGSGYTSVLCDGSTQNVVVRVSANPSGLAFAKGAANADTYIDGCRLRNGRYMCGNDVLHNTVKIKS